MTEARGQEVVLEAHHRPGLLHLACHLSLPLPLCGSPYIKGEEVWGIRPTCPRCIQLARSVEARRRLCVPLYGLPLPCGVSDGDTALRRLRGAIGVPWVKESREIDIPLKESLR